MPRTPKPVHGRRTDERAYEKDIRNRILSPLFIDMTARFRAAAQLREALVNDINVGFGDFNANQLQGVSTSVAEKHLNEINRYHRAKMVSTFRSALGVNINPLLLDAQTDILMRMRIQQNVQLIRSIPIQLQGELINAVTKTIETVGFDQQKLIKTLEQRFNVAGSRAKLIARDQTTKTIGALTKARQNQIGVKEYTWVTSHDERVRSSHAELSGTRQLWSEPPAATGHPGHSVQCRCVARAVIEGLDF